MPPPTYHTGTVARTAAAPSAKPAIQGIALPVPATAPTPAFVRAVWWQDAAKADYWVKQRGCNVLWWDTRVHDTAGDWTGVHAAVESLRQQGYPVWVVRQPAYLLTPDKLDVTFDQKWAHHLLAFDVGDELEDKVTGGDLFSNPQPIYDAVAARIKAYKAWMSGVPIAYNFNGTHVRAELKDRYDKIVASGVDILSSDVYPFDTQQSGPDGKLLYPDITAATVNATALFKAWYADKQVWTFFGVSNQDDCPAGQSGWAPGYVFAGSRAPTATELRAWYQAVAALHGDGIAYFPQSKGTMDATDPALIPVMQEIAGIATTPTTPAPPPSGVGAASGATAPAEPSRSLVTVVYNFSDGTSQTVKL